jgi:hypothetical protein
MTRNTNLDQDRNYNQDRDRNNVPANDNGKGVVASASAGGALVSLAALKAALDAVDTSSVAGRSGLPMLQFKRDGNGTWMFGQKRTVPEEGSNWAANPRSFKWGFICFDANNKVVGERLVPISQPKPDVTELPDKGFEWSEQWAVNMKCTNGADAGAEVVYKPTTVGGIQAVAELIEAVRDRLNSDQHDGKISPIIRLDKDSYQHGQYGRVWTPILTVVGWLSLDGVPAPKPVSPPPAEQPRRRRVA